MLKVSNANMGDVLTLTSAGNGTKGGTVQNDFKNLLGEALQGSSGKTAGKEKPAKTGKNMEAGEPLTSDIQEQTITADPAAAAVAVNLQQPVEPQKVDVEQTQAQPIQTAAQPVTTQLPQATPEIVAPVAAEQGADTDILSVQANIIDPQGEVTVPSQPAAQPPVTVTEPPPTQDRFGNMLDQAQQQLQDYQNPVPPQPAPTEQDITRAQENEATEIQIPDVIEEQTAPARDQELLTGLQTLPGRTTTPFSPVEVRTMEQRPVRELPEEDRTVMEMREAVAVAQPKPLDNIQTERTPEPTQVPRNQPQVPDQAEQIRAQVTENLNRTNMEFRMQLNPQELGKIDIRMVIEGGRLAVEIMAQGTRTADLLNRQVDSLVQSLRVHAGIDVQSVQVTQTQASGSHMDGAFNMLNGQAQNGGYQGQSQGGRGPSTAYGQTSSDEPFTEDDEEQSAPETLLNYAI